MKLEVFKLREFTDIAKKHGVTVGQVEAIFKLEFEFLKDIITSGNNETVLLKGFGGFTMNKRGSRMKTKKDFASEQEFIMYMKEKRDEKTRKRKEWIQKFGKKESKSTR